MNRLMQTDINRLDSAISQHAKGLQQQPESVSAETANDFRRLMGEGENSTDVAQQNATTGQHAEKHQNESTSAKTVHNRTGLLGDGTEKNSTQSDSRNNTHNITSGATQDVTKAATQDATKVATQDVTNGITKGDMEDALWQNDTTPTSGRTVNPAVEDAQHSKQNAKDNISDRTEETEPNTANNADENTFSGMTNPFSRMFSDNMPKLQSMPTEAVSSSSTADLAEKFIEHILVSQPDKNGQEIRLQLSQESGMNAEVRLVRGIDGSLSITMHAEDATTFQNLVAAQDRLKAALISQERGTVRVEVLSQTDQENNDTNRRSRGYMPPENED